jgi:Domain of unknown function (DUF4192)
MTPDCSITVRSSAETVAAAPYVIGFHPTDSIVVVGAADGVLTFAVRYDLPPPGQSGEAEMARLIARQEVRDVTVLGYGPPARVTAEVLALAAAIRRTRVEVADVIRVADGRWWSYLCTDPRCCPPEGRPIDTTVAAAAVYQGLVALPDRQALVRRVAPAAAGEEMSAAAGRARARFAALRAEDRATLRGGGSVRRAGRRAVREAEASHRCGRVPSDDEVAWLGVLLTERGVLGYALDRAVRVADDGVVRLWTDVLRRVPAGCVSGPGCLLALAAWRSGDGALARVALDRALRENPRHPTAVLLDRLLCSGIAPGALRTLEPPRRGRRRLRGRRG